MNCNVKKQHYVPRFYLRKFSSINDNKNDKKNKIIIYDKKHNNEYKSNVYDIATENYFYNLEDETSLENKQVFENFFSNLESQNAILFNRLINCCIDDNNYYNSLIINKKEKRELSFYIVMQLIRTKKYREKLCQLTETAKNKIIPFIQRYYEVILEDKKKNEFENIKINVNKKNLHLDTLIDVEYIEELTDFIFNSCWIFFHNKTTIPFIISDNPVCRIPRIEERSKYFIEKEQFSKRGELYITGFESTKLDIYFPLCPYVSIRIIRKGVPNYNKWRKYRHRCIPLLDSNMVEQMNVFQYITAYEKIFINPKDRCLISALKQCNLSQWSGPIL